MEVKDKLREGWALLKNTAIEWWNDNTFRLAAALAFYTIFSIAPVLLIAVGAASLVFSRESAVNQVVAEMQRLIGQQGAGAIRQVLESSAGLGKGAWAIAVGIVTLVFGATIVFAELQSALNHIWREIRKCAAASFSISCSTDYALFDRSRGRVPPSRFARAQRRAHRLAGLSDELDALGPLALAGWQHHHFILRRRAPLCHDLQISARRSDRMARRLDRCLGDLDALRERKISHQHLPWAHCDWKRLWRSGLVRRAPHLDLLFCLDQLFRRGVYPSLRAAAWSADQASGTRQVGWQKEG